MYFTALLFHFSLFYLPSSLASGILWQGPDLNLSAQLRELGSQPLTHMVSPEALSFWGAGCYIKRWRRCFLVAYWLGFWAFSSMAWVQFLVGELRSRKLHGMGKTKKKRFLESIFS